MPIVTGVRLEHYEILAQLGAGGMGEVYRARDTRLNREVAIKILPVSFANDPDRLRRFEVEALATSALNHPNILTIHGFGTASSESGGAPFIVAELLQGAELRSLLSQSSGPLPMRTVIDYARQIAAGLAAAHEKGIIHRDLKPENLFVTADGRVKILDFGLAKLKPPKKADSDTNASTRKHITDPGTVMGTAGYMSPEQVRGQEADHRADIFSFGAILYEMLSGQRAFDGDSSIEVMNSILKHDPAELTTINHRVPQGLERLVSRCLEKKPEHRFHSAHDLGYALEALSSSSGPRIETQAAISATTNSGGWSRIFGSSWPAWAIAAVLLLVTIGATWAYFTHPSASDARVMKFSVLPPEKASFAQIALSPDGHYLAFTALTTGKSQLWVRAMDTLEARLLPGTQDALFPFWSPDSRFIGFFAGNSIKKIELSGGPIQTICEAPVPLGASWSRDGVILFGQWPSGLGRVSATGGTVTPVTTADASRQEFSHHFPTFLPDGNFVFTISSEAKETRGIYVGSLDGKIKRRLIDDGHNVKYMPAVPGDPANGWLLYGRDGALLAQPFDARRLELTGEPVSISDKLVTDINAPNYYTFTVSDNGMLVYDSNPNRKRRQYEWVDRRTQHFEALGLEAGIFQLSLSPDDKRFVVDQIDPQIGTYDLWLHDARGGSATRFTFDPQHDFSPIWSPDGTRIVWSCSHQGIADLYQKASSLDGEQTVLLKTAYSKFPTDWSHDGQFIIYTQMDAKTKSDVWAMPTANNAEPFPVARSEANEGAGTLSPDGKWLAYTSDVSGRDEIYVQRFPGGGGKRQISTGGGGDSRWSRDGRELFYYGSDGRLMAVPVKRGEGLEIGTEVPLFTFRAGAVPGFQTFAPTSDGQRFLINAIVEAEPNAPLTVVVNWPSQIKK